jgi:putative FmdB family regulatory protein
LKLTRRAANFIGLHDLRPPSDMPTYEYRCPAGHEFEKFTQKMSDAQSELPCPSCGKVAARRMSAGGGLVFKGSGFYITDYGKDGKKDQRAAAAKPDTGGEAKASSSDGGSSTPAPAAPSSPTAAPPPSTAKPAKSEKTEKAEKPGKKSGPAK